MILFYKIKRMKTKALLSIHIHTDARAFLT